MNSHARPQLRISDHDISISLINKNHDDGRLDSVVAIQLETELTTQQLAEKQTAGSHDWKRRISKS